MCWVAIWAVGKLGVSLMERDEIEPCRAGGRDQIVVQWDAVSGGIVTELY